MHVYNVADNVIVINNKLSKLMINIISYIIIIKCQIYIELISNKCWEELNSAT